MHHQSGGKSRATIQAGVWRSRMPKCREATIHASRERCEGTIPCDRCFGGFRFNRATNGNHFQLVRKPAVHCALPLHQVIQRRLINGLVQVQRRSDPHGGQQKCEQKRANARNEMPRVRAGEIEIN
jgi:hypothetical protein